MDTREKPGLRKRSSVVNGIFYPENPETMAAMFASWGLKTGAANGNQVILAPHGAWDLTGSIAAAGFIEVQKKNRKPGKRINRVLLLGAIHDFNEEGIYLSESVSFEPPHGDLLVDQRLNRLLASCSTLIRVNDIPHLSEHSLEVLLPLVKHCFPEVKIVPILMCGKKPLLISCLAKALRVTFERHMEDSLIVVSSSISRDSDPLTALTMANEFSSILEAMDTQSFLTRLTAGHISACGAALLGALLESGLLDGKHFSSLCPLIQNTEENGETVYHGAFVA
jgi:hypothetical protein